MTIRKYKPAALILLLIAAVIFTAACGSQKQETQTLESFLSDEQEGLDEIKQNAAGKGFEFGIEGNTVTFTFKAADKELTADEINAMKPQLEDNLIRSEDISSRFAGLADDLSKMSGIDGVTVRFIITDGAGTEICSGDYTAGGVAEASSN